MISKDGQMLSAYDTNTGSTKIIAVKEDGSCEEQLDLGFPTGKVEFSYDSKAIAFHVDSFGGTPGRQFSGVNYGVSKNVYVLELKHVGGKIEAGKLRKITSNTAKGEGSYYPSFTVDGKVVYVHGGKDKNGSIQYSFRKVDPGLAPASDLLTDSKCEDPSRSGKPAALALGALWSSVCAEVANGLTGSEAALWTLNLDSKECIKMVRSKWSGLRAQIVADNTLTRSGKVTSDQLNQLTQEALEAACPAPAGSHARILTHVGAAGGALMPEHRLTTGAEVFEAKCMSCHGSGASRRIFDYQHLSLNDINNMLIAISSGDMPREKIDNREETLQPLVRELQTRKARLEEESKK